MTYAEKGAARYFRMGGGRYDMDELRSAAYLGLVIAARKFDPSRGLMFSTMSFWWIDRELKFVHRRAQRAWGGAMRANQVVMHMQRCEWPTDEDGEPLQLQDRAADDPEELAISESDRLHARQRVLALTRTPQERRVMGLRLDGLSMKDIATREGVTRARIHQVETKVRSRVRK